MWEAVSSLISFPEAQCRFFCPVALAETNHILTAIGWQGVCSDHDLDQSWFTLDFSEHMIQDPIPSSRYTPLTNSPSWALGLFLHFVMANNASPNVGARVCSSPCSHYFRVYTPNYLTAGSKRLFLTFWGNSSLPRRPYHFTPPSCIQGPGCLVQGQLPAPGHRRARGPAPHGRQRGHVWWRGGANSLKWTQTDYLYPSLHLRPWVHKLLSTKGKFCVFF